MKPTKDKVQQALAMLTTYDRQQRFYSGLSNPDWFDELAEAGVFTIRNRYDDTEPLSWPAFEYLVTVAGEIPDKVARVLGQTDSTSPFIRRDLVRALLKLPDAAVAATAKKAKWLRHPPTGGAIYSDLINVIERLCSIGEIKLAVEIARWTLQLNAEPPPRTYSVDVFNRAKAVPTISEGAFKTTLDGASEAIFAIAPIVALEFVADRLDRAQTIEGRNDATTDLSCVWMDSLASTDPPARYDAKMDLAWRFATLARQCSRTLDAEVEGVLAKHDSVSSVYRRTRVLRLIDQDEATRAEALLVSRDFWADYSFKVERPLLLQRFFGKLNTVTQTRVVEVITDHIPTDAFVDYAKANFGREPTADELQQFHDRQLVEALKPIAADLQGIDAAIFHAAQNRLPEPVAPVRRPDIATLEALGAEAALERAEQYLWEERDDTDTLFHELQMVVQRDPNDFIALREQLRHLHPENLGAVFSGAFAAKRLGTPLDQARLLDAVEDAARQATTSSGEPQVQSRRLFPLHTWTDILRTCGLIMNDLVHASPLDQNHVDQYLSILHFMAIYQVDIAKTRDPGGRHVSSLDSIQGMATVAIATLAGRRAHGGHSVEREMRELDHVLSGNRVSAKAALGQSYNVIYGADAKWARANVDRIFLSGDRFADAMAWLAYLASSQVYAQTYEALKPVYRARLVDLNIEPANSDDRERLKRMLAHIWVLCANDIERLGESESLVRIFLRDGTDEFVARFLYLVGGDVTRGNLPTPMVDRAIEIFGFILKQVEAKERDPALLRGFGSWVSAAALSAGWRLASLETVLRLTGGTVDEEHSVVEALAMTAAEEPIASMRCIRLLVEALNPFSLMAVSQFAGPVFEAAIDRAGDALRDARRANDVLVNNGMTNFMVLFNPPKSPPSR